MIEIKDLAKRYGSKFAVDHINFTVQKGEILGFLGPNGAGKTTTMNIITGYTSATEGTVTVDGYDILEQPNEVKKRIGYLPEQPPLYIDMTVSEYLNFVYEIKKVKLNRKQHIDQILEMVQLGDVQKRLIKNLSKGYKQRVGLAQAMMGGPEVLILDEPTVGLDPKQIIEIRNVIRDLGKEHTIILSSHILPEVSAICERVIIINKGKIVAIDSPENLSKGLNQESKLTARISGPMDQVLACLRSIEGIHMVECQGEKEAGSLDYFIQSASENDIRKDIFMALSERQFPMTMLKANDLSLEDIFLQLTTDETNQTAADVNEEEFEELDDQEEMEEDFDEEDASIEDDEDESEKGGQS